MGLLDSVSDTLGASLDSLAAPFKQLFGGLPELYGDDFTAFIIEELPVEGVGSKITLVGEWRPHQPFQWGGSQHLAKEYYPGNPEPTVQVLGSRETEMTINGRFKVKRMKAVDEVTNRTIPSILCDEIDEIRKRGSLVKLTLGEWERWGFIETTDWMMKTLADIDYKISFFIIGDEPPSECKLVDDGITLPVDLNTALITAATELEAASTQPFSGINLTLFQQINGLISTVATALKLVTTFVDTALTAAEDVQKLANRAIGLIKYAQSTISSFKQRVGALDAYYGSNPVLLGLKTWNEAGNAITAKYVLNVQLATSVPPALTPAQVAAAQTKTAGYTPTVSTQQQAAAQAGGSSIDALLAKMLLRFTALAQTVPKARYLVKSGDTLETISLKFYNTTDNWLKIYTHNQLTTTVLAPATVLEIPKL